MISTLKSKAVEISALFISLLALQTSCSNQEYVEASYHNAQKVIIVSDVIPEETTAVKLSAVSSEKRLLSAEIIYPEKFLSSKDYVSGDGVFKVDQELIDRFKLGLKYEGATEPFERSVRIPTKIHARYAAQGSVYNNSFIYALVFHIEVIPKKDKESSPEIKIKGVEFDYLSTFSKNLLFMAWTILFGLDETMDINQMFENGVTWSALNTPGKL
ncbi:hypothetical protein [Vibrio sp. CyArs1]|uniref:hypothetical protein n=1 Tax=Vibrio sp. CyArs1 TaxID=2682577 RepID=UPI001F06A5C8|nr:hypothetical protein [Vibrio sp. CyArs1]